MLWNQWWISGWSVVATSGGSRVDAVVDAVVEQWWSSGGGALVVEHWWIQWWISGEPVEINWPEL